MIRHNCGLVVAHSLDNAYEMIRALQHRGREAVGIAAVGDARIDVIKWLGTVDCFEKTDLHLIFPGSEYHTFLAHVRYATRGSKVPLDILRDAHPHTIGGVVENRGNHVLVRNADFAIVHNGQVNDEYLAGVESDVVTSCDSEALLQVYKKKGARALLQDIPGAYTLAVADVRCNGVVVLRDRTGIRPGALGRCRDGKYGVASEDVAFRETGGTFEEYLDPGSVYYLDAVGRYRQEKVVFPAWKECFFEWNYVASEDAVLHGRSVKRIRMLLGEKLAKEFSLERLINEYTLCPDVVTFVPRCPEVAARSYAKEVGVDFKNVFYKIRRERSFQGSTKKDREESIKNNLFLRPQAKEFLAGKSVVIIDDSVIRGNVVGRVCELLKEARVRDSLILSYTPPIGVSGLDGVNRGCLFGIDMPPSDMFVARGRSVQEIAKIVGMRVEYLSRQGMLDVFSSFNLPEEKLCTYCIGGEHPFKGFSV